MYNLMGFSKYTELCKEYHNSSLEHHFTKVSFNLQFLKVGGPTVDSHSFILPCVYQTNIAVNFNEFSFSSKIFNFSCDLFSDPLNNLKSDDSFKNFSISEISFCYWFLIINTEIYFCNSF